MTTVSVIIPAYQSASTIVEAVESVLAQTLPVAEIIVIDDGSTDDLIQVLDRFAGKIRLIRQENVGAAAARNNGIRHATGDIIAFLDADDIWLPEKLALQLPLFENPGVGVVYGNVNFLSMGVIQKITYFDLYKPYRGQIFQTLFATDFVPILSVLLRRQIFEQAGFFDEAIRYVEDYDLLLRISKVSEFDYIDVPVAVYRISSNQISKNFIRAAEYLLNLKERVYYSSSDYLGNAKKSILERGFYNKYLKLAMCYIREGRLSDAGLVLDRYHKIHRRSLIYTFLRIILIFPKALSKELVRVWDKLHQKPELGVN